MIMLAAFHLVRLIAFILVMAITRISFTDGTRTFGRQRNTRQIASPSVSQSFTLIANLHCTCQFKTVSPHRR